MGSGGDEEAEYHAITDALDKVEGARTPEAATQRGILEALLKRISGRTDPRKRPASGRVRATSTVTAAEPKT